MKADILSLSEYAYLAEISTLIFMAVFIGALVWMFRPGSREVYEAVATMPLDDQNPVDPINPHKQAPAPR
ncbi:MAG: cbb3-type cytochrome c oxidase subunit 3 [Myxococcales bacterium]|nr:cbb3-type cytochrome c oxidase subunit 3 [Myxococcales bacterium]MCA9695989.1 cbb3-type cytochrome c oxidase subunit 3 [Myxococcales bacterium]